MPAGAPTAFRDEYCELATNYCLLGATDAQLAEFFDVSETTINNWKIAHPEFLVSVKAGKDVADAKVANALYHRSIGYSHEDVHISNYQGEITETPITKHYPPESKAITFWLTNRQRKLWSERKEVTGADGKDLIPEKSEEYYMDVARRTAFLLADAAQRSEDTPT